MELLKYNKSGALTVDTSIQIDWNSSENLVVHQSHRIKIGANIWASS
jgi:hypothetical protein